MKTEEKSNLVRYQGYSDEMAAEDADELAKSGSQFLKLPVGTTALRFLPARLGKRPLVMTHQHVINVPGVSTAVSFNCSRAMLRKPCVACQRAEELKATGNPADYEVGDSLYARLRVYANVIDRANEALGPQVFAFGKKVHEALVGIKQNPKLGGDFTDPSEDGFDVLVVRAGTGKNDTKYTVSASRESSPLSADAEQANDWIEVQTDLDRFAVVPTVAEIQKRMGGLGTAEPETRARAGAGRPALPPARRLVRTAEDDADGDFSD